MSVSRDRDEPWITTLEANKLRQLVGARSLDLALASAASYVEAPALREGAVHAVVAESTSATGARVWLNATDERTLVGECDRCSRPFGPCVHMAILALDLALSATLRAALLEGQSTTATAAEAPGLRAASRYGRDFERALSHWTIPQGASHALTEIDIAAGPVADADLHVARGYADRVGVVPSRAFALFVRYGGEKKLLTSNEIVALSNLRPADKRVLAYARQRGGNRRSVFVTGNDASLALEELRQHGRAFVEGYKRSLDFRSSLVRPAIRFERALDEAVASDPTGSFEMLRAFWRTDDDRAMIPFSEAILFAGPFPYVWTNAGAIYPVARDVDLELASGYEKTPSLHVPRDRLKDAGARLLRSTRGRGVVLPSHVAFGLPALERPRILLRLAGAPLAIRGDLVAVYRTREVSILYVTPANAPGDEDRDVEWEARARDTLDRAVERSAPSPGFAPDAESPAQTATTATTEDSATAEDESDDDGRLHIAGDRAAKFWQTGLEQLRMAEEPSIEVELSSQLARARIGAPISARVNVALEGHWLKTKLDFRSDDLPVELARIREALGRKERWISLDDGTLTRINSSIETLADEASEVLNQRSEARLPLHQLGRLDRWIEENNGSVDAAARALRKRLRTLGVAADGTVPRGLCGTLRPYQSLGLAWLQFLDALGAGGILADDMGLGKTITTLAYLLWKKESEGPAPSLVVCPTSVATNWVREAKRFAPDLRIHVHHGASRDVAQIGDHDIVITTYGLLRRDGEALGSVHFRAVVLDEAQNIKNADSATTRAAMGLRADMRLALSGTPMENRLRELWSLMSFANPGMLGRARTFETRYELPIAADSAAPAAAELRALLRPFLLRRTKSEVLTELPPKTEIEQLITLSTAEKRMYSALALTLRESVKRDAKKKKTGAVSLSVLTALTRLRQMACDPRLVDTTLRTPLDDGNVGAKRAAFLELVRELVSEGRRALVFSQFVSLLTLWRQDLERERVPYEYLDGATENRQEIIDRFQNGRSPLFLISLRAGGVGLNLTAADTVILCDPWWNPAVEDQATDRAHRPGQQKPVTVFRLISRGTIEEKILALKAKKRALTAAIIDGDAGALKGLTDDDVRILLGDAEVGELCADDDELALDPTDVIATHDAVVDPEFYRLVRVVQEWITRTGRLESELATLLQMPHPLAVRLSRGEPFPCSRATGDRIRANIASW